MKNGQEVTESSETKFYYRHIFSIDKVPGQASFFSETSLPSMQIENSMLSGWAADADMSAQGFLMYLWGNV